MGVHWIKSVKMTTDYRIVKAQKLKKTIFNFSNISVFQKLFSCAFLWNILFSTPLAVY